MPISANSEAEIKHDGFRVIARKDRPRVRLYTHPGNDLSRRMQPLAPDPLGLPPLASATPITIDAKHKKSNS
jgi:ATP-dependent DNA ligase